MSSATGRNPTDAGSLLTGRHRLPPGDAANAANPVNAQHLPGCSTADSPLPKPSQLPSCLHCPVRQRLTYFHNPHPPSLPFYPSACHRLSLLEHKKIATRFRMTTFQPLFSFQPFCQLESFQQSKKGKHYFPFRFL